MKLNKGLTTIELVVVIGVVSLLMIEAAYMLTHIFTGYTQHSLALENIDNARLVASQFVNEIRSAVYGVDGSAPIIKADSLEITFHSPDRRDPSLINRIRYFVSGNNLYKGIIKPSGIPQKYNPEDEKISLVQKDLVLNNAPVFLYYDGSYDGDGSPLFFPPNIINDIRYVKINLTILKQTEKGSQSVFNVSTGATIRSLKDNLGN